MKIFIILQLVSYRMTIVIFKVFAGKTCSAVSPLPQDFYANFGGDPFTDDAPHDSFMRSVFSCREQPYSKFYAAMTLRAAMYMNGLPDDPRV